MPTARTTITLPVAIAKAVEATLLALRPLNNADRLRALHAVELLYEGEASDQALIAAELPSLHPDKWTRPPLPPPLPVVPDDAPTSPDVKGRRRRK